MNDRIPAIFGGTPIRDTVISYGRQWITDEDADAVVRSLKSDIITSGPNCAALEKKLCEITGAKYAVVVSNGTAALHCAAIAAGLGPSDEVITTPITFEASANCAVYVGATPVFADIREETYNIDPDCIEAKITEHTRAVVAVDFTGQAVENDRIREICLRHGLVFIEDAAHSINTKYNGRPVGSMADMTCFSFHPVKTVTAGEGGAITTNDETLYRKLRLASQHGIIRDPDEFPDRSEDALEGPWYYEMVTLGFNYRMTDFQAALLLSQLNRLEFFSSRRKEIVKRYNEAFAEIPGLILQKEIPESDSTRHLYILRVDPETFGCTRRELYDALKAENIRCQIHYVPVYWFPFYQKMGHHKSECPVAEKVYSGILSIPLYPMLTDDDVDSVIRAVRRIADYYRH